MSSDFQPAKFPRSRSNSISSPLHPDGVSTYSPSIRTKSVEDADLYIAGQALVPVVNNPGGFHRSSSGSYGILSWTASASDRAWAEAPVPPSSGLQREVSPSDFEDYLQRVGVLIERYQQKRISLLQDNARRMSVADPDGHGYLRGEGLVQALRQVPSLYFQEDFSLTRPETFAQVIRGETTSERNATLETLTSFLDIVETELLNEIAARSDSFFEAAESLQDLQKSIGDTLFQIQRLQVQSHNIDNGMCSKAETIQALNRKRCNMQSTLELLRIVESVTHGQNAVDMLLLAQDYSAALDLTEDLRAQYDDASPSNTTTKAIDKLKCLKHMPEALDASVVSLRACFIADLLEAMSWDDGEIVLRDAAAKALGESGRISPFSPTSERAQRQKLSQILLGLSRTGAISEAFSEVVPHAVSCLNSALRNVMEILLPNFVDDSVQDVPQAAHLQRLTHEMFLSLLEACLSVASACIGHYSKLGEYLLEATDDGQIIQHRATVDRGRTDLCRALMDACQHHWTKLFEARTQTHQFLSIAQLQQLIEINCKCDALAARVGAKTSSKLSSMLKAACKNALEKLHKENLIRLKEALEKENWKQCLVDKSTQEMISVLVPSIATDSNQVLKVGDREYRVVAVVTLLAMMICEFFRFSQGFPEFVTDTGRHFIELIRLFNKRSCQLVLGAQAMHSSGLKSITAKHLALCSQSILFLMDIHQVLVDSILDQAPQTKRTILTPEFDRLKQDLALHLEGIHSKLIDIMKERLTAGIVQLKEEINSKEQATEDRSAPTQSSQQIAKQLRILTQVLTPILHQDQMQKICSKVAEIFGTELGTAFKNILNPRKDSSPKSPLAEGAHKQINTDCSFLIDVLSKLPVGDRLGDILAPLNRVYDSLSTSL